MQSAMNNTGDMQPQPGMAAAPPQPVAGATAANSQPAQCETNEGPLQKPNQVPSRTLPARTDRPTAFQARLAYMRFGLGPKQNPPREHWTTPNAAYEALKAELTVNQDGTHAALIPEVPLGLTIGPDQMVTGTLDLNGVPTAYEAGCSGKIKPTHPAYGNADMRAHHRMAQLPQIGFLERLVLFWSNHFSMNWKKSGPVNAGATGHFERTVIRKHVLGNFPDMLQAAIQHSAMLGYLDNNRSSGPNSLAGGNIIENLARELLELHTVGKYANYSQCDVMNLSYLLTGYTINDEGGTWNFRQHELGDYTLLGTAYPQTYKAGFSYVHNPKDTSRKAVIDFVEARRAMTNQQSLKALRDLAVNPYTRRNLATKMIAHFIGGTPATGSITKLAEAFGDAGDLKAMALALLELPEAWDIIWTGPRTRLLTPQLALAAMNRALGLTTDQINVLSAKANLNGSEFFAYLQDLNHAVWERGTPDGYPDVDSYWFNGSALRIRRDATYRYLVNIEKILSDPARGGTSNWTLPLAETIAPSFRMLSKASLALVNSPINFTPDQNLRAAKLTLLFMTPEFLRR